jgi:hypothetical protein
VQVQLPPIRLGQGRERSLVAEGLSLVIRGSDAQNSKVPNDRC